MDKELSANKPVVYKREFSVGESIRQSATRTRKRAGIEYNMHYGIPGAALEVGREKDPTV